MERIIEGRVFPFTEYNLDFFDNTGFTFVPNQSGVAFHQCIMCLGLILIATPDHLPMYNDPFQLHRENCYGWNK